LCSWLWTSVSFYEDNAFVLSTVYDCIVHMLPQWRNKKRIIIGLKIQDKARIEEHKAKRDKVRCYRGKAMRVSVI